VRQSVNNFSRASSVLGYAGPAAAPAGRRGVGRTGSLLPVGLQPQSSATALGGLSTQASSISQLSSMRSTVRPCAVHGWQAAFEWLGHALGRGCQAAPGISFEAASAGDPPGLLRAAAARR
jgi:hypothetical protein